MVPLPTTAPLGSLGDRTLHNPFTVKHHKDKPLCQNKAHLASDFWSPLQKKQDLGIQQPNPIAYVAGFPSLLRQTDSESVVLRTPMPRLPPNQIIQSVCQVLYCVDKQTQGLSSRSFQLIRQTRRMSPAGRSGVVYRCLTWERRGFPNTVPTKT